MQRTVRVGPEVEYSDKVCVLAQSFWDNMDSKVVWAEKTAVRLSEHLSMETMTHPLVEALVA